MGISNLNSIPAGNTTSFEECPTGTFGARIVQVIDFGLQPMSDWKTGAPKDPKKRVFISFEIPSKRRIYTDAEGVEHNQPFWVGKELTISSFPESGMMKLLSAIAPNLVNMRELLNMPVMVSIGRTSGGKAKITNVAACPEGFDVPELENETSFYDSDIPSEEDFKSCKPWQQVNIISALDYNGHADAWVSDEVAEKASTKKASNY